MTDKERIEELKKGNIPQKCEECYFARKVVCDTVSYYECLVEDRDRYHEEDIGGVKVKVIDCPLKTIQSIQNQKAVEALQKVKGFAIKEINECNKLLQEETTDDYYIQAVNARQSMCFEFRREIDQLIKELGGNT